MRKLYTSILLILLGLAGHSQKESNIWYFGYGAGLDFNSGAPVTLTNGQISQWEGVATVSDAAGSLLFYTDGITVWNRVHAVMNNGNGLLGDYSSTQSATIVPKPGSTTQYYIFTTGAVGGPFCYSIVDMT